MMAAVHFTNPQFICSVGAQPAPAQWRYVVFAGRSNAGKSSVINALCGGRYARVAKTPGRTRLINLFQLGDAAARAALADLPGYGYAVVSKAEQRGWGTRLTKFLRVADIRCVALIVDCRRGIGDLDRQLLALCEPRRLPLLVVLNKADKLSQQEKRDALADAAAELDAPVVLFSALKKTGVREVQTRIRALLDDADSAAAVNDS